MKRSILFFAFLVTSVALASAQNQQRSAGQNILQNPAAKSAIEGTVTRADNGQPLKGARVSLQPGARPQLAGIGVAENRALANLVSAIATVTTDGNGRFTFTGVDPGQYVISAERDGFIRSEYGQRTATGNGIAFPVSVNQQLPVDLKMLQASVVSGRIVNAEGEPAAQTTVQAYTYRYSNGQRTLAETRSVQTNDLGEYRLYWLPPGEYFVSVSDNRESGAAVGVVDVSQARGGGAANAIRVLSATLGDRAPVVQALGGSTNPPVFYPGTIDPDAAIAITVPASSEVRGMDFHLRPLPTATVSGRVIAPFPLNQGNTSIGFRGRGAAADWRRCAAPTGRACADHGGAPVAARPACPAAAARGTRRTTVRRSAATAGTATARGPTSRGG